MMRKPPKKQETISIKVAEDLAKLMDQLAARQHRSRSDVIRHGLLKELEANGLCVVAAA